MLSKPSKKRKYEQADSLVTKVNEDDNKPNGETLEDETEVEGASKKSKKFYAKEFRKLLADPRSAHSSIIEFVALFNQNSDNDYAMEFIDAGGTLMEILHILDGSDKKHLGYALPIFEAATLILLKIQSSAPHLITQTDEACRYLLNNYIITIHTMLNNNATPKQRRTVLKLLTSIVTLSPLLAKEILIHVEFSSETLTSLTEQTEGLAENSIRTAWVHFLLAFIIDGQASLIRALLDKKELMGSIFPGMIYDEASLVRLVLTAVKSNIIENLLISKTLKLTLFNTSSLRSLVNLYNWKGRTFWKLKIRKKVKGDVDIDPEDKSIVTENIHNFLILLCTSRKFGIAFHDKTFLSKDCNKLLLSVLQSLDRAWEHQYPCELVLKIAEACPDLVKFILSTVENYLDPRSSVKFLNAVSFVKRLITSVKLDDLNECQQISQVVSNVCIPNVILSGFIKNKVVIHGDPYLREVYIDLVVTIFRHYEETISKISWFNFDSISEYLVRLGPPVNSLVKVWGLGVNKDIYSESREIFSEYLGDFEIKIGILDLFSLYYKLNSKVLKEFEFTPEIILKETPDSKILYKASDLFLNMDFEVFKPDSTYFLEYMGLLLSDIVNFEILERIFKSFGLFNDNEVLFWLNPLHEFKCEKLLPIALKYVYENRQVESESRLLFGILSLGDEYILTKSDWKYLNLVILQIFHSLSNIDDFVNRLHGLHKKYCKYLLIYLNSWLSETPEAITGKLCSELSEFSMILLSDLKFTEYDVSYKFLNLNALQMSIFYFTHLAQKQLMTIEKSEKFLNILIQIFEKIGTRNVNLIIYNNEFLLNNFNPLQLKLNQSEKVTVNLILNVTKYLQGIETKLCFDKFNENVIKRINTCLNKFKKYVSLPVNDFNNLVEIFNLDYDSSYDILLKVITLPTEFLIYDQKLSIFAHILKYTLKQLKKLYKHNNIILNSSQFILILNHFTSLNQTEIDTEILNSTLFDLIEKFPHFINIVDLNFFESLISKKVMTKVDSKLVTLLLRNRTFLKYIISNIDTIYKNKILIFPLLETLAGNKKIPGELIYQEYEFLILKTIEKPHKVGTIIHENVSGIIKLIKNHMPIETCSKLANKIHKFDSILDFHIQILETVYTKAIENTPISNYASNYIQTLINLSTNAFKHENQDQIYILTKYIQQFLNHHNIEINKKTENIFIRNSLKYGMKTTEPNSFCLLQTLRTLLSKSPNQETSVIYEMITSHSEFLNIILSNPSPQKVELLAIIHRLIELDPNILNLKLVPILLGGYSASTSLSDKLILSILYKYEQSNLSLFEFTPFIWGELAVNHYAVRQNAISVQRQPKTSQVLDLFKSGIIYNTIINFNPAHSMTVLDLPDGIFDENVSKYTDVYTEQKKIYLQNKVEVGLVYDLNFCLPLFSDLLSSNSLLKCYKFTRSGCFALALLGLGSECDLIRQAAYNVLARIYFHLEADAQSKDAKIWLELINRIRGGILRLGQIELKDITKIRLPYISTVFLARSALIMTQPYNPLYIPINNFIFLKEQLDFTVIPEFLQLFHSADVNYKLHRYWLLQVIRDGIKSNIDFPSVNKSVAFKMLFNFYFSNLSDQECKTLLLEIVERACLIPKISKYLLFEFSLMSWLSSILNIKLDHKQVEIVLEIIGNLYKIVDSFGNEKTILLEQLLLMLLKMSELTMRNYCTFIQLLSKISKNNMQRITRESIVRVIDLGTEVLGENDCYYILEHGAKYLQISEVNQDSETNVAIYYLRRLIADWMNSR